MAYRLIIEGFTSKAQVQAFADWYGGAGEQDAGFWFEERKADGEIDVDWMGTKGPLRENKDDIIMTVDPQ